MDVLIKSAHILIPPGLGVLLALLSFIDDALVSAKVKRYLEGGGGGMPSDMQAVGDTIGSMVDGAVLFTKFLSNTLLFVANCFIAFLVFSSDMKDIVFFLGVCSVILMIYELIWMWGLHDLTQMQIVWFKLPLLGTFTAAWVLKVQQVFLNALILGYFVWGCLISPSACVAHTQ
jgi:hypothetical protein